MIRFSAGLVVVAIGVLIGGVATSKLSLVYVAIAVSAVALVVLAIGVALKRDELFGGGPELAPASAGAGSGMPVGQSADTGHDRGSDGHVRENREQIRPNVPVASQQAAFAGSAASLPADPLSASPPVESPVLGNPPSVNLPLGQRRPVFGHTPVREADSAADWQTRSPQPPWSSGDQVRPTPTWTPKEPTPKEPQPGAAPAAPRAWGSPDQPPAAPVPTVSAVPRAGSGIAAPSWFDRLNQPVADPAGRTDTPAARTDTDSAKTEPSGWPWSDRSATRAAEDDASTATQTAADASDAGDDDDDWPTRYSWLEDDETDEAAEAGEPAEVVDEVDDVDTAVPEAAGATSPATVPAATVAAATVPAATVAAEPAPAESITLDPPESLHADAEEDADVADDADGEGEPLTAGQSGAKLVTVIPGVPRYHEPDCILIRFMDSDDIAKKSVAEAKAANCTPCAACQPEG